MRLSRTLASLCIPTANRPIKPRLFQSPSSQTGLSSTSTMSGSPGCLRCECFSPHKASRLHQSSFCCYSEISATGYSSGGSQSKIRWVPAVGLLGILFLLAESQGSKQRTSRGRRQGACVSVPVYVVSYKATRI